MRTILLLALFLAPRVFANLQVYPTRLLLDDKRRVTNLAVRHLGDKPQTFKVSAIFYRMNTKGQFELIEEPTEEERPLTKLLRFSPREVKLEPNREQIVRVMYAGPGNLPEGEYRAHLHIVPADEEKVAATSGDKGIQLNFQARLAFAIPVVFRRGNPSFKATVSQVELAKQTAAVPTVSLRVDWSGTAFPYGDYVAFYTPPGGEPIEIGDVKGAAAYVSPRFVDIPLQVKREKIGAGTIKVEFRETAEKGAAVIATGEGKAR